ncbi:C40 family peptidase [Pelagibacterales bacterium SAG-MED13]|nr:C40 family peptidase [Pelagibacterales bacterium SAG-MED13]
MKNNFFNLPVTNIYEKPYSKVAVSSQILYGEKFKILSKKKKWLKIKTSFDNYIGFIKKNKFNHNFKPKFKIFKLKSRIFKKKNNKFLTTNNFLYFGSGISLKNQNKNFIEFENNKWIKKKDLKNINHYEKNFIKILKLFLNCKYLWGGKTSKGIDCSALIQIYFYYNRVFFPRDTKDQIKFCKKKLNKNMTKGDIIFWKGHVGMCINDLKFIHAYGPKKKVVIMKTDYAIRLIKKTANLIVKKVSNINNY